MRRAFNLPRPADGGGLPGQPAHARAASNRSGRLRQPPGSARAGEAAFPRWTCRPAARPRRPPGNRGSHRGTGGCPPGAAVPGSGTCGRRGCRRRRRRCTPAGRTRRRRRRRPPVSSSGGKKPGKADEAVTAIGTVASPTWMRSMRTVCPGCRRIISRPLRLKEHRQPSLRLVARMCSCGFSGSSNRLVSP